MKHMKMIAMAAAAVMMASGCSISNGKAAIKVGDAKVTEGGIKFYAENALREPDIQVAADALEDAYFTKELADKMNVGIAEEDDKRITSSIASLKSQLGGKKAADKLLKSYGLDDDDIRTMIGVSVYEDAVIDQLDVEDPTDEEVEQYFKDKFLRAKHVLIMTQDQTTGEPLDEAGMAEAKAKADDVLAQAQSGANFDTLISQFGEDPGMESNPDGYIFTDGEMVTEFEDAVKSIQPGEITMCETSYGYHIIQRLALDETPEKYSEFFEDNKSAAKNAAKMAKEEDAMQAKAEELGIQVEKKQDVIDSIELDPTPEPTEEA